jgi:twitching motility protein PilT
VIREGNTPMISSIIQSGKGQGMQSMDDTLFKLATEKRISAEDAFHKANNKARFEPMLEEGGGAAGGH